MKALLLSVVLVMLVTKPVLAQTATSSARPSPSPQVMGIYDSEWSDTATRSASASATPRPTATPVARTTVQTTTKTPVAGAVENTIALLLGGSILIIFGIRFARE